MKLAFHILTNHGLVWHITNMESSMMTPLKAQANWFVNHFLFDPFELIKQRGGGIVTKIAF